MKNLKKQCYVFQSEKLRYLCPVPKCMSLVLRLDKHLMSTDAHKDLRDQDPEGFEEYVVIARNMTANADPSCSTNENNPIDADKDPDVETLTGDRCDNRIGAQKDTDIDDDDVVFTDKIPVSRGNYSPIVLLIVQNICRFQFLFKVENFFGVLHLMNVD